MESNPKETHQTKKQNTTQIYTPNTHFIIDKNLFHCIICYDISPNVYETSCCATLVCHNCKAYLQTANCPVCKIKTEFKISKIAKRFISNSITECPVCDFTDKYDRIASHLFKEHKEYILKNEKLEEDQKLFNFLSVYFCISLEKKFFMHNHPLHLVTKEKDCVCYAGSVLHFKNCRMIDKLFEEEAKDKYDINNAEENIEIENKFKSNVFPGIISAVSLGNSSNNAEIENNNNNNSNINFTGEAQEDMILNPSSSFTKKISETEELKNFIMQRLVYFCSECEGNFCDSCLEGKDIWVPTKVHQHPLNLINKNNGWSCDGRKCPDGCFNEKPSTVGLARYRCVDCDFDLCERCLMYYMC